MTGLVVLGGLGFATWRLLRDLGPTSTDLAVALWVLVASALAVVDAVVFGLIFDASASSYALGALALALLVTVLTRRGDEAPYARWAASPGARPLALGPLLLAGTVPLVLAGAIGRILASPSGGVVGAGPGVVRAAAAASAWDRAGRLPTGALFGRPTFSAGGRLLSVAHSVSGSIGVPALLVLLLVGSAAAARWLAAARGAPRPRVQAAGPAAILAGALAVLDPTSWALLPRAWALAVGALGVTLVLAAATAARPPWTARRAAAERWWRRWLRSPLTWLPARGALRGPRRAWLLTAVLVGVVALGTSPVAPVVVPLAALLGAHAGVASRTRPVGVTRGAARRLAR